MKEFLPPISRPVGMVCSGARRDGDAAEPPDGKTAYRVNAHTVLAATRSGERLLLHLADRVVAVPAAVTDLVADILARDRLTSGDLPDHRLGTRLVRRLEAEGVIEADPSSAR